MSEGVGSQVLLDFDAICFELSGREILRGLDA